VVNVWTVYGEVDIIGAESEFDCCFVIVEWYRTDNNGISREIMDKKWNATNEQ
jgi:hypothetical protein